MAWIYKITSPENKSYVGSTINIKKRWASHRGMRRLSHRKLIESFNKHGVKNHVFEILEECSSEIMLERETFYGLKYNVLSKEFGLNLLLPKLKDGTGGASEDKITWNKGIPRTDEEKRAHSLIMSGRPSPFKGIKTNKTPWNKGIPLTKSTKEKLSEALKGRPSWNKGKNWSEESKIKMSESSKGSVTWNKGLKSNSVTHNAKIVLCLQTGIYYLSSTQAAIAYNMKRTTLQAMLNGQNKNKTNMIYV